MRKTGRERDLRKAAERRDKNDYSRYSDQPPKNKLCPNCGKIITKIQNGKFIHLKKLTISLSTFGESIRYKSYVCGEEPK